MASCTVLCLFGWGAIRCLEFSIRVVFSPSEAINVADSCFDPVSEAVILSVSFHDIRRIPGDKSTVKDGLPYS